MARQQIVLQAVQQLAPNANFKVDAYIKEKKKNLVPHLKTEKTLRSPLYPQLYILNMYCTQCYLTNHTGQLSHTGKERAVKAPHTDWIPILCTFFTVMSWNTTQVRKS